MPYDICITASSVTMSLTAISCRFALSDFAMVPGADAWEQELRP
jgi:hypothetical protein